MPRTDLLEQSPPRVEVDQRSRDARLRLEHVERLLVVRPLPRPPLLKRLLRRLGSQPLAARQGDGGLMSTTSARARTRREPDIPAESGSGLTARPPGPWPRCRGGIRLGAGRLVPVPKPRVPRPYAFKAWKHWCGRGDLNSHVLSDNRF
jgi:hypothetical protein